MVKPKKQKKVQVNALDQINPNAAGIDIGAEEVWVAVPADRDEDNVRVFSTFTADLHNLASWLKACQINTVAMESTGVYWIPVSACPAYTEGAHPNELAPDECDYRYHWSNGHENNSGYPGR